MNQNESRSRWEAGIPNELEFWRTWLEQRGREWPDDYRFRFNPSSPLRSQVEDAIRLIESANVNLLEVGCGPVTSMGYVPTGDCSIHAVYADPLAMQYGELLTATTTKPMHPIIAVSAEELDGIFFAGMFDVVVAKNCLDHAYDPRMGLRQIGKLIRKGGCFVFSHLENEADRECREGLHHWNFSMRQDGSDVDISGDGESDSVAALLDMAIVKAERDGNWINAIFQKK